MVKLKCNTNHIHALNCILAYKVKKNLNTLYGHLIFLQNLLLQKEGDLPQWFLIRCHAKLAYQVAPKIVGKKLLLFSVQSLFKVIWMPQNGLKWIETQWHKQFRVSKLNNPFQQKSEQSIMMKKTTVRLDWLAERYELIRYSNATTELKIMLFSYNRGMVWIYTL